MISFRCRAPIASLDCMEEFSGAGVQLDFGIFPSFCHIATSQNRYILNCINANNIWTGHSLSLGSNPAIPLRPGIAPTPGLRYKNLGKSGLRVSNVGLGTWPIFSPGVTEEQAEAIIKLAYDSGINIFDISEAHSGML